MSPNGRKLVILSLDAAVTEDLETLRTLPVLGHMLQNGALAREMEQIYPTLTYPSHVTMLTGATPEKHGVINNYQSIPGCEALPWNWYHDVVRCRDLMDEAKKAGLTTATVGWPVMGKHPHVDYLVDEIWPMDPKAEPDIYVSTFLGAGTSQWLMESCVQPYVELRTHRRQPDTSWFHTYVASDIIRAYSPDVIAVHLTNVDHYRHVTGVFSPKVTEGLRELDEMVRHIVEAVQYSGMMSVTDFCIISDHGQINVDRVCQPNVLLQKAGLIDVDARGNVTGQKAYSFAAGCSAQVVLDDPGDWETYSKVQKILTDACRDGNCGIERVYTKEEVQKEEYLTGGFSFVLEGDGHTSFGNKWTGPLVTPSKDRGNHGHHPAKGPKPFFFGYGPDFLPGKVIPGARLIDEAPTFAQILGIPLPDAEGKAIGSMLRE